MPKYRQLPYKILDSYDFNDMPDDQCRLFWVLLPLVLDCEGRGVDNPAWLRSRVYPLREDIELNKIAEWMDWLGEHGLITRYEVDGRKFFYATKFKTYQSGTDKEARSTIPAPPDLLQSNSGVTPDLVRVNTIQYNADSMQHQYNADSIQYNSAVFSEICKAYESEIGALTPIISDELESALKDYPPDWFLKAFQESAKNNARSWKYALAILRRWKVDGVSIKSNGRGKRVLTDADGNKVEVDA